MPTANPKLRRARRAVSRRASAVVRFLRTEQIGGLILLGATALALIVANTPLVDWYDRLSATVLGPQALHLDLTVATWAKDGLLAFFFVVAGLELKSELGRRRAARAAPGDAADRGRGGRDGRTGARVPRRRVRRRGSIERLGRTGRDRHRVRARGARHHGRRAARERTGVPAVARDRRRPRRDPADRHGLHRPHRVAAAGRRGAGARALRRAATDAGAGVAALLGARAGGVGAGARVRCARDGGRCGGGSAHPGTARSRRAPPAGRGAGAPAAAVLRRRLRTAVRVLRRRRRVREIA